MEDYSKDDLREDFDLLIQAWLKSGNENTTFLADSLATYAIEKLNGEIRESDDSLCVYCNERPVVEPLWLCKECIIAYNKEKQRDKERT